MKKSIRKKISITHSLFIGSGYDSMSFRQNFPVSKAGLEIFKSLDSFESWVILIEFPLKFLPSSWCYGQFSLFFLSQ